MKNVKKIAFYLFIAAVAGLVGPYALEHFFGFLVENVNNATKETVEIVTTVIEVVVLLFAISKKKSMVIRIAAVILVLTRSCFWMAGRYHEWMVAILATTWFRISCIILGFAAGALFALVYVKENKAAKTTQA